MKTFLILAFFLLTASSLSVPIQDQYRSLKSLKADIEQVKSSPLLLRPMKSQVTLEFKDNVLTWSVAGQEPLKIKFVGGGKTEFLSGGKALNDLPADARAKLDKSLSLIHKILVMEPSLDQDFVQTWTDRTLDIKPKDKTVFFEQVIVQFKTDKSIESILLKTRDEETRLNFKSFEMNKQ